MKFIELKTLIMLLAILLTGISTFAQTTPVQMDLYLLIGQSNMAGRGVVDAASQPDSPQVWAINRHNEWKMAGDPLHEDKPAVVGVGPGLTFAQEILKKQPERVIGLIPCAVGGSGIEDWQPGAKHEQTGIYAYDEMLLRVKEAQKRGMIKGIIWHQGESDSSPEKKDAYAAKLGAFFERLRRDTHTENVPLIVGTLGDFYVAKHPDAALINQVIVDYAKKNKLVYLASASGLTHKGDDTHFDTASARELGRRYAEAFLKKEE
ncbi:sialate O-acetylesterase [Dyadobacter sp. CY261]|uniref:sialate O-acetylesterase n=1 Tax=Dyadobacter sp. CY261 TaxID=2907203 RepID=UPI001F33A264|nr:sialate O-acetylesterase [Dyadobacter sp. CY261]MCF0074332.1 sialate O-acetylesterase [Dyadobacter sp. CY261]